MKVHNQHNNNQPKVHKVDKVVATLLAVAIIGTSTATISGTFAWFTYAARAYSEYQGVTIGDLGELQCGIRSMFDLPQARPLFFEVEQCEDGSYIYWAKEKMTAEMIQSVTEVTGYATDKINPVTSGAFSGNEDFHLYYAPTKEGQSLSPENYAEPKSYNFIPFVFRIESLEEGKEGTFLSDMPIYMSRADLTSENNIQKSIRIHTKNNNSQQYLISPSENNDGSTNVGGALNIVKDNFYDTFLGVDGKLYEKAYGQFEGPVEYNDTPNSGEIEVKPEDVTSFRANHVAGSYSIKDSCKPKEAKYNGMSKFRKGRTPITATTGPKNYANLDLTIFSEGWDLSVIDSEKNSKYSLDLKFEIVF